MQFSSLITILTVAMTAAALPAADVANNNVVVARTGGSGTPVNECSVNNEKPFCCNPAPILGIPIGFLSCVLGVIGGTCSGVVKCCNVDAPASGSITLNVLTCGIL
ncbi:Putative hydrophobin precursor [Podospora comata]|uniref:Hydrophobin n=1 Tax=Podospora comata TaxID=48703 RepID=A0ABY6S6D1_PODCO|nr:Putative hydrophobin precursor [Podospora comata]